MQLKYLSHIFLFCCSLLLQCSKCTARNSTVSNTSVGDVSTLRPVVERVFSRRRRFLLMPQRGRLKFTCQLSKRLIATIPSGFNFNIEAALYYPMITNRIDLIPKRLRPKTTTTPKPKGSTTPLIVHIPGSLIRYKAKPAAKPAKVQRIDEAGQSFQWIEPSTSQQSEKWIPWAKYSAPNYEQKYAWQPQQWKWQQPVQKWNKWTTPMPWPQQENRWQQNAYKWQEQANKWQQKASKWQKDGYGGSWTHGARWQRGAPNETVADDTIVGNLAPGTDVDIDAELDDVEPRYAHFEDLVPHEDWKYYHNHRDRRQLYHQFEGLSAILGIDFKSCIMRAICDCKRFLLPPGYSLVQDVLRLMFTFPTRDGLQDDYSRIVQSNYETCDELLRAKCPFNILNWLMGHENN